MRKIIASSVIGTGAAINVSLGFVPDYVKVFNPTNAARPVIEWHKGMTAGHGLKSIKIVDSGSTDGASQDMITSNGISAYAGTTSVPAGFTIGADTDLNVDTNKLYYLAVRN